ncbi:MAG: hypothetical protein NVS3B7_12730 [Candidatus Elarobacter sp.]
MTAFFAAGGQDTAAVFGGHAFEEAVDALAASVVRLIGPLHERVLLVGKVRGRTRRCDKTVYGWAAGTVKENGTYANAS